MFTGFEDVDSLRHLEQAVQLGMPVLLQNIMENLDASLDLVLNKSVILVGELRSHHSPCGRRYSNSVTQH